MLFGFLNINKPAGMTSREVVDNVEWITKPARAGHAGTLDPLATGVLVVAVGPATRLIEYVQRMPKHYVATFRLGCRSPTDDIEGELTEIADAPRPPREQIEAALVGLRGEILQRPPAYSAVKVGGRRAYQLARRGKPVELPARPVTVHRLTLAGYDYPELVLDIQCSSGTYVRSLGRDLAESLGSGAVMSALVRRAIGPFRLEEAVLLDELSLDNLGERLLPPLAALEGLPRVELVEDEIGHIARGMFIERDLPAGTQEAAAVDAQGRLLAVLVPRGGNAWGPVRNFATTS